MGRRRGRRRPVAVTREDPAGAIARAYDRSAAAWQDGPGRLVYDHLAVALVALVEAGPVGTGGLAGRRVLDVGSGTGAASRAITAAGGTPVAVDRSPGMLRADPAGPGRSLVSDATRLGVATGAVDGVVAAFSFNHLPDPVPAFREAVRVCGPGSPVLVATYAADDAHPAKGAVERALAEVGWAPEPWYEGFRSHAASRMGTPAGLAGAAAAAGLEARSTRLEVEVPGLGPDDLIRWRLGMAQTAPFLAAAPPATRAAVHRRARSLLGDDPPPLRRALVVAVGLT